MNYAFQKFRSSQYFEPIFDSFCYHYSAFLTKMFYPSTIQIYYNKSKSTMINFDEDDGIMINACKPKTKQNQNKTNKMDNKRSKYTVKFRKQKSKERINQRQNKNKFQFNLLPEKGDTKEQMVVQKEEVNKQIVDKSSVYKERKSQQKNSYRQHKKDFKTQRKTQRKSYSSSTGKPQSLNLNKVKVQTPWEIKPQQVQEEQKIDKDMLAPEKLNLLLQDSLTKNNISTFTKIQHDCFTPLSEGKDIIAKASTGTGKTLAYLIPLVNRLIENKFITSRTDGTIILVICPSRQLCLQGQNEALRCLKRTPFIVPGCLIGGEQTNHEKQRIRKGIGILFCTPGRLIYHLKNTKSFKFDKLKTIIFEEADRTLDLGFLPSIKQILDFLQEKAGVTYVQKILVSAHFNDKVAKLIQNLEMSQARYIGFDCQEHPDENHQQQINISQNLKQHCVLMNEQERISFIVTYMKLVSNAKVLIFVNTIDEVQFLEFLFNNLKYRDSNGNPSDQRIQSRTVYKIHGDIDQKLRSKCYFQFRKEKNAILISTEVASRGLDFPDLTHIILFDVPPTITDYGNRVGRSARFNSSGVSLLMLHYQQSDYAQQIRYYAPKLEMLNKQVIYQQFEESYLKKMNIGQNSAHYVEGIVRGLVKADDENYQVARKAYVSMLRAYAKMPNKLIFAVKKLDLKALGRCFGLNSKGGKMRQYNPQAKESYLEGARKKRNVSNVKKLQVEEYM